MTKLLRAHVTKNAFMWNVVDFTDYGVGSYRYVFGIIFLDNWKYSKPRRWLLHFVSHGCHKFQTYCVNNSCFDIADIWKKKHFERYLERIKYCFIIYVNVFLFDYFIIITYFWRIAHENVKSEERIIFLATNAICSFYGVARFDDNDRFPIDKV